MLAEAPAAKVEKGELGEAATSVAAVMSALKDVYDNSSFYTEARVVSFLDHMQKGLLSKIGRELSVNRAAASHVNPQAFAQAVEAARSISSQFLEGYFLRELMIEKEIPEEGEASLATKSSAGSTGQAPPPLAFGKPSGGCGS